MDPDSDTDGHGKCPHFSLIKYLFNDNFRVTNYFHRGFRASESFLYFAQKEEDVPAYHRRYDFFIRKAVMSVCPMNWVFTPVSLL